MSTLDELLVDPWFPFEGDVRVKRLEPPVVPEPPRVDLDRTECGSCARPDDDYLWTDGRWRLSGYRATPVAGIVLLESRGHVDSFADLPDEALRELGPLTARIERVLLGLGDVGRVHVNRWGDGGAHFHLWFMPRPLGAMQLRGSMLPVWLDLLPVLPDAEVDRALDLVAAGMAGGPAHP